MKQSISIVTPTFHRRVSLLRLLESLASKTDRTAEIIIVEQEDNNGTEIKNYAKRQGLELHYYILKERSTSHAMNVGVEKANGEYILFLDDDVTVHKDLVKAHLADFKDARVAATVGRLLTDGQEVEPLRTDTGRIDWLGNFSDGFSSNIRQEVDTVIGANTCWRKDVYEKLGGMDEQFTGNALRLESDLSLRAKEAGYKIIFEQNAIVDHHREPTGGARKTEGRLQWYYDFFSNETYFFLKHKPMLLLPVFLLTKISWALRCMFGFGREVSFHSMTTPFAGIMNGFKKYKSIERDPSTKLGMTGGGYDYRR